MVPLAPLKARFPAGLLARGDEILQRSGLLISPSVFLDLKSKSGDSFVAKAGKDPLQVLRCPETGSQLRSAGDELISQGGLRWRIIDGVFDFRQPVN